jgi:hypothetical protein
MRACIWKTVGYTDTILLPITRFVVTTHRGRSYSQRLIDGSNVPTASTVKYFHAWQFQMNHYQVYVWFRKHNQSFCYVECKTSVVWSQSPEEGWGNVVSEKPASWMFGIHFLPYKCALRTHVTEPRQTFSTKYYTYILILVHNNTVKR